MTEAIVNSPDSTGQAAADVGQLTARNELDPAWQRQVAAVLQEVKKKTREIIEEVGRTHASLALAELQKTLTSTVAAVIKTHEGALWTGLQPALRDGADAVRQKTDG